MLLILAILLSLSAIVSPGQYYQAEIDDLVGQHQQEVDAILDDPIRSQSVLNEYGPAAELIDILDSEEQ